MKINIGAGIQFRSGLARDVYAAGGVRPEFVAAFSDGVYRVDSAASTFADAFTFARTGTATFVDADGILQTAADGVARTGHHIWNGSEWTGPFLRFESEARTNLVWPSNDFTSVRWTKQALGAGLAPVVTDDAATSPDGTTNADLVAFDLNGGTTTSDASQLLTPSITFSAQPYTYSLWMRVATGTAQIRISIAGAAAKNVTVTDEWQRFETTWDASAGTFNGRIGLQGGLGLPDTAEVYVFGVQLEAGSTLSSYIPTTGTTATRNAETRPIDAADAPYSATAMSGAVNSVLTYADDGSATQQTIFDRRVDANNRITVTLDTSGANTGRMVLTVVSGGTTTTVQTTNQITPGINVPANVAWRVTIAQINIALNGTAATAVTNTAGVPDVSAADATIAIMGAEEVERHWADDIGDAGIAAASA